MEGNGKEKNAFVKFITSPFHSKYPSPMTHIGDYVALVGAILYVVCVFALNWISVGLKDVLGVGKMLGMSSPQKEYGLFVSPWAWVMVGVLVVLVLGMYFVQTRGGVTLGIGIFCLIFNVVFYIGAWQKINSIIGDIVNLAKSVPFIGQLLGEAIHQLAKTLLSVHVAVGFWLFIPAGLLLVVGGLLRLASKPRMLAQGVAE
jgi:hypothetical protein